MALMIPEPRRGDASVVSSEAVPVAGFRWIAMRKLQWRCKGSIKPWEVVERTTKKGALEGRGRVVNSH